MIAGSLDPVYWDAGDFHRWERPEPEPCRHCRCCSARLCRRAIAEVTTCLIEGGGSGADFDLADCPCWREGSPAAVALASGAAAQRQGESDG